MASQSTTILHAECDRDLARCDPALVNRLDVSLSSVTGKSFRRLRDLKSINVSGCGRLKSEPLEELIARSPELCVFDGRDSNAVSGSIIRALLRHAKHLEYLDVNSCSLGRSDIEDIKELTCLPYLTYVGIPWNLKKRERDAIKEHFEKYSFAEVW